MSQNLTIAIAEATLLGSQETPVRGLLGSAGSPPDDQRVTAGNISVGL